MTAPARGEDMEQLARQLVAKMAYQLRGVNLLDREWADKYDAWSVELIAAVLQQARREVWEEAAKLIRQYEGSANAKRFADMLDSVAAALRERGKE